MVKFSGAERELSTDEFLFRIEDMATSRNEQANVLTTIVSPFSKVLCEVWVAVVEVQNFEKDRLCDI